MSHCADLATLDEELSARLLAGDPRVKWELVIHFGLEVQKRLRWIFVPPLRPRELYDVVYDAAVSLWKNRADFDQNRGTLFACFYGHCWQHARSKASSDLVQQRFHEIGVPPTKLARLAAMDPGLCEEAALADEQALARCPLVAEILRRLSPREQHVLLAGLAGEVSTAALAAEMGVSPPTVRVLRWRIRNKAGPLLTALGYAPRPSRD